MKILNNSLKVLLCFGLLASPSSFAADQRLPKYAVDFEKTHRVLLHRKKVSDLLGELRGVLPVEQLLFNAPLITRYLDYRMPKGTFKNNTFVFYEYGKVHKLEFLSAGEGVRLDGKVISAETLTSFERTVSQIHDILGHRKVSSGVLFSFFIGEAHALSTGTGLAVGLGLLAVAIGYFAYKGIKVKVDGKTKHDVDVKGGTQHNVDVDTNHALDIGDNITGIITGSN